MSPSARVAIRISLSASVLSLVVMIALEVSDAAPESRGLYMFIALLFNLVLLGFAWYKMRVSDPILTRLTDDPESVRDLPIDALPTVHEQLRRTRRLKPLLRVTRIRSAAWDRGRAHADHPARALAWALGATLDEPSALVGLGHRYLTVLPELPIPLDRHTAILDIVEFDANIDIEVTLRDIGNPRAPSGRTYLFLIDRTREHTVADATDESATLQRRLRDTSIRVVVFQPQDITRIVLADNSVQAFCQHVASQAKLGDISPYQVSGGLRSARQFFGRESEVAVLMGEDAPNHLLIGARQMGKSSILRRMHERAPKRMHLLTLTGADLDGDLQRAGLPPLHDLCADGDGKPPFLLLDEADKLIAADRKNDYTLCRTLRAISEEGRCRFVLAGFWELHRAAYLEHQSPVRNFANPLPLGPFTHKAARTLATQPLAALGLNWSNDDLIETLLYRTGRRPNLIALACDAVIRALEPLSARVIDASLLRAVLDVSDESGKAVASFFGDLGGLIDDPRACRIDRMLMFAAIDITDERDQPAFTLTEARKRLEHTGIDVPIDELRASIARLNLAYVLQKQQGAYIFPVPLVRDALLDDSDGDPADMLSLEARGWRDHAAPPQEPVL